MGEVLFPSAISKADFQKTGKSCTLSQEMLCYYPGYWWKTLTFVDYYCKKFKSLSCGITGGLQSAVHCREGRLAASNIIVK